MWITKSEGMAKHGELVLISDVIVARREEPMERQS